MIDVGTNVLTDRDAIVAIFGEGTRKLRAFERRGEVLSGDVHPEVATVAGALTPVPGGVGPLTIAMLLSNTVPRCRGSARPVGGRTRGPLSRKGAAEFVHLPRGVVERFRRL